MFHEDAKLNEPLRWRHYAQHQQQGNLLFLCPLFFAFPYEVKRVPISPLVTSSKRYIVATTASRPSVPGPTPAPMSILWSPPALREAVQLSEETWQSDLHDLFKQAKDRFPDILWERDDDDDDTNGLVEVWGHKGTSEVPSISAEAWVFTVSTSRRVCSCSPVMASKILSIPSPTHRLSNSLLSST